jgi:UDP-2,3-diacylglucosamine hydrolase
MSEYYFISDLHLGFGSKQRNLEIENIFLRFLDEIKSTATEIFIVGDLFDVWIEYRQVVPKGHYRILSKIYELVEKGIKVNYLAGNHDFWRSKYFKDEFGIELTDKPVIREIDHKKFFITHGDGLAYHDTGYKILKKILRNKVCQFLYSWIHPDIGIWLARKSSAKSRDYTDNKEFSEHDGMKVYAFGKIDEGMDYVILGHRHRPAMVKYKNGHFIVLGDWIKNFSYGIFRDGEFKLFKYYDLKTGEHWKISEGKLIEEI